MRLRTKVGTHQVQLSRHAVERYVERIRHINDPTDEELDRYSHELCFLIRAEGQIVHDAPAWTADVPADNPYHLENVFFIIVGEAIAFPVSKRSERFVVATTLTRGGVTHSTRQSRNIKKQRKRQSQRNRRQFESWRGEKHQRWN